MPAQQQQAAQGGAQAEGENKSMFRSVIQNIGIFLLVQFAIRQFMGTGGTQQAGKASVSGGKGDITSYADRPLQLNEDAKWNPIPNMISPMWEAGIPLDISIYISPSIVMPGLKSMPKQALVMEEKEFQFGNYSDTRVVDTEFDVPREVANNGTLFAHFFIAHSGSVMDPRAPGYNPEKAYTFAYPLTQTLPKKKVRKQRNLLAGKDGTEEPEEEQPAGPVFASYFHPNFTLSLIPDSGTQSFAQMHPAIRPFVHHERTGARDATGQNGWYYPILYVNTFWQLRDHMTELNSTVTRLPLHFDLQNQRNWIFQIMSSIDAGMKQTAVNAASGNVPATGDGSEFEEFKRVLLDSNVYLLATTGVASVLHMIFEMLAFKSDVSHWRNKKDNIGTSVRTIIANVVMQLIIFLYLMDNNEHTSWMILFGQGMGIAIEAWKITKAVNVRVRPTPDSIIPYSVVFEDKHKLSDVEQKTQEYDQIAFYYLYRVAVPLLLAYAGYSLYYETHKSWYSFVIATLVGSVYAYGFLMMVPSLYINYRLKSVAHMPARAMTYKFLNTFIDDLFAFTIKMPTLHRLATLRDDVIFFVYLYQSWKYKVDYTRVNEFGQGGDEEEEEAKKATKPLEASPNADVQTKLDEKVLKEGEAKASGKGAKGDAKKRK